MALDPNDYDFAGLDGSEQPPSPLAGTRSQSIQRLQVGLFGLAAMVMVLGLADIIMSTAENNQVATAEELPPVSAEDVPPPTPQPQRDPLAEAGVVPDLPAEPEPEAQSTAVPAVVVPPPASNAQAPANAN